LQRGPLRERVHARQRRAVWIMASFAFECVEDEPRPILDFSHWQSAI
jgi:hypothetical protein